MLNTIKNYYNHTELFLALNQHDDILFKSVEYLVRNKSFLYENFDIALQIWKQFELFTKLTGYKQYMKLCLRFRYVISMTCIINISNFLKNHDNVINLLRKSITLMHLFEYMDFDLLYYFSESRTLNIVLMAKQIKHNNVQNEIKVIDEVISKHFIQSCNHLKENNKYEDFVENVNQKHFVILKKWCHEILLSGTSLLELIVLLSGEKNSIEELLSGESCRLRSTESQTTPLFSNEDDFQIMSNINGDTITLTQFSNNQLYHVDAIHLDKIIDHIQNLDNIFEIYWWLVHAHPFTNYNKYLIKIIISAYALVKGCRFSLDPYWIAIRCDLDEFKRYFNV